MRRTSRVERAALGVLLLFTVAAVTGFGTFALHPELLPPGAFATDIYRLSYPLFAQLHIVLSALVLGLFLSRRGGARWLGAAVLVCAVSFLSEHVGTGWGLPFGEYRYTGLLGPKVGGRVPWLIPPSWFLMAAPSYILAAHVLPGPRRGGRLALATALLVAWDLALDPAMSFLTPYWIWGESGAYYGMPAVNLVGWAVTGAVLMVLLEAVVGGDRSLRIPARWTLGYYATVLLLPLGMLVAAGAWLAVAATSGALAGLAWIARAAPREAIVPGPGSSAYTPDSPPGSSGSRGVSSAATAHRVVTP